jgi:glycosyltransferase involved in cell wall biosynthesis
MRNVLFIHPYFGNGGAEKGILTLASGIRIYGYRSFLVCIKCEQSGMNIDTFENIFRFPNYATWQLTYEIIQLIKRYKFELIILNQAFVITAISIPLFLLKNLTNRQLFFKVVAFERLLPDVFFKKDIFSLLRQFLYYQSLKAASILMTNSYEQYFEYYNRYPSKPIVYVPNSSLTSHFQSPPTIDTPVKHNVKKEILWIGRLSSIKSPILAIQCLNLLPMEWSLTICGNGDLKADCKRYVRDNNLDARVLFRQSIDIHIASYTCMLFTSQAEGLPNAIIEALCNNVPVISTMFRTGLLELSVPSWIYISSTNQPENLAKLILDSQHPVQTQLRNDNPISSLIQSHYSVQNMITSFTAILELPG